MRGLAKGAIGLFVAAAVLWAVAWLVLAENAKRQTLAWFEAQALSGRMAGHAGVAVTGFPFRLDLEVTEPYLANPFTGQSWAAPAARLTAQGIAPLELRTDLAERHTLLLGGHEVVDLTGRDMVAEMQLAGADLALAGLALEATGVQATGRSGWGARLAGLEVVVTPDTDASDRLHLRMDARGLGLDAAALAALGLEPGDAAPGLDVVAVVARLALDRALDRHLDAPPALREIALDELRLVMGQAELHGSGVLEVMPDGLPVGQIDLRLRNWRSVLETAVALGLMHPEIGKTWENLLNMLSETGADGAETVALPLTFRGGRMRLGPLPIGAAPMLAVPF